jgi:hypothetical protein
MGVQYLATYPGAGPYSGPYGGGPRPETWLQRQDDAGVGFAQVLINQWAMRSFGAHWWLEPGAVTGQFTEAAGLLHGRVTNGTKLTFDDSFVVYGHHAYHLGRLAPGKSAEPRLVPEEEPVKGRSPRAGRPHPVDPYRQYEAAQRAVFADQRLDVRGRKKALLKAASPAPWEEPMYYWRDVGSVQSVGRPRFYGWREGPLAAVHVSAETPTRLGLSLYVAEFEPPWHAPLVRP